MMGSSARLSEHQFNTGDEVTDFNLRRLAHLASQEPWGD